jgi:hypothetical protein
VVPVRLAEVRAVAAGLHGEVGAVVQDHRHAAPLRHRPQCVHRAPHRVVRRVLEADLQGADVASVQRPREVLGEPRGLEGGRRDQVQSAALPGGIAW